MSPRGKPGAGTTKSEEDDAAEDLVAEFGSLLGGGDTRSAMVQVYRKRSGKRDEYLDALELASLGDDALRVIKDHFGGGEYALQLTSDGKYVKGSRRHIAIAGAPKRLHVEGDEQPDADDSAELAKMEARILERLEKAREQMSTGELLREVLRELRDLREGARNPPAAAAQANPADMALSFVQAVQTATAPYVKALLERQQERPMDTILEAVKLVRELGAAKDDGFGGVIREVAQPLSRLVDVHVRQQEAALNRPPAPAPAPAPRAAPDDGRPGWWPQFGSVVPQLLGWARKGGDPEAYADFLLQEVPDTALGPIHNHLSRGDEFLREWHAAVPEAASYAEWFERFFRRLLAGISWDDGADGEPDQDDPGAELGGPQ